jgi:molybdopterin synthase sulfur carrier subunit
MPHVQFTTHLRAFFPTLQPTEIEGGTVAEVVTALERLHSGIKSYLIDERGALRPHVNIFVGDSLITDRQGLTDIVGPQDQIYILQALSGG